MFLIVLSGVFAGALLTEDVTTAGAAVLSVTLAVVLAIFVPPARWVRTVAIGLLSTLFIGGGFLTVFPNTPRLFGPLRHRVGTGYWSRGGARMGAARRPESAS